MMMMSRQRKQTILLSSVPSQPHVTRCTSDDTLATTATTQKKGRRKKRKYDIDYLEGLNTSQPFFKHVELLSNEYWTPKPLLPLPPPPPQPDIVSKKKKSKSMPHSLHIVSVAHPPPPRPLLSPRDVAERRTNSHLSVLSLSEIIQRMSSPTAACTPKSDTSKEDEEHQQSSSSTSSSTSSEPKIYQWEQNSIEEDELLSIYNHAYTSTI